MHRAGFLALLTGCFSLVSLVAASAQTFHPAAIEFKGAPDYSQEELLAAVGLKLGTDISDADMKAAVQGLMNSGLFAGIQYDFDGKDLVFQITPAHQLYPVHVANIPLAPGTDLDAGLRQRVPLYRGKVPSEGKLLDDVQAAFQDMLKAQGIQATVAATPFRGVSSSGIAMAYSITSPQVLVGQIQPDGGPLEPDAQKVLAGVSGSSYDFQESSNAIQSDVAEVYRGKGYLQADARASQLGQPTIDPDAIRIPFHVSVTPGPLFHITAIQLAPDMLVSQADFDKQAHTHPGDIADIEHVAENIHFVQRQYHNRGLMKAQVVSAPTLDPAHGTVSYAISAVTGPVYTMGNLTIENVSDELRTMMLAGWKMPSGAVFNEGAILGFFATHGVNPQLERVFAGVNLKYTLRLNDDKRTVDVTLRLEKRT